MINMGEIKIVVSDEMDKLVQKVCDELGIKKTEYLKSLLIQNLKEYKYEKK